MFRRFIKTEKHRKLRKARNGATIVLHSFGSLDSSWGYREREREFEQTSRGEEIYLIDRRDEMSSSLGRIVNFQLCCFYMALYDVTVHR